MMVPVDRRGTRQRVDLGIGNDGDLSFIQILTCAPVNKPEQDLKSTAGDKGFGRLAQ